MGRTDGQEAAVTPAVLRCPAHPSPTMQTGEHGGHKDTGSLFRAYLWMHFVKG